MAISFTAPLTPTIRRYLDISAKGGPSKPKPAARPIAPPIQARQPVPAGLPEVHHDRPQHHRLNALGGKASRPPLASTATAPIPAAAGPSEPHLQPVPDYPIVKDTAGPALIRITRNDPLQDRADGPARQAVRPVMAASTAEPPYPSSWHVRSASHAVLPTAGSSSSLFAAESSSSAMGHPARPALPSSFSTSALAGTDHTAVSGPARRFPPPARRLHVPAEDDDFAPADHAGLTTPGLPLRGAARPVLPPHMPIKRPLGQAQRRVVTAPLPTSTSESTLLGHAGPVPAAPGHSVLPPIARQPARSVRDRVQELEKNSPQKTDLSPRSKSVSPAVRLVGQTTSPIGSPLSKRAQDRQPPATYDSPAMPVLARSTNRHVRDEEDGELLHEPAPVKPHMIPLPGSPNSLFDNSFNQDRHEPEEIVLSEAVPSEGQKPTRIEATEIAVSTVVEEVEQPASRLAPTDPVTDAPLEAPAASEEPASSATEPGEPVEPVEAPAAAPAEVPPSEETGHNASTKEVKETAVKMVQKPTLSRPASAMSASNSRQGPSAPALMTKAPVPRVAKTSKAPLPEVRLPPTAAARKPVGRVVSAPERRPFKPTSQANKPSTLTAPTAATAARATASASTAARPAPKAADTSAKAASQAQLARASAAPAATQGASASSRAPSAAASSRLASTKPGVPRAVPKARVASAGFAAPTQASTSRTGPATASTANKPSVTGKIALPPAPRVKVTLKPPVPKFVPKSTLARGTADSKLASSTTSSLGGSTRQAATGAAPAAKGPIRARVKPQNMPPPLLSREERAKLPAQDIPLPSSPGHSSPRSLRPASAASQDLPGSPSTLMLSDKQRGLVGVTAKYRPRMSDDEVADTPSTEAAETTPIDDSPDNETGEVFDEAPKELRSAAAEDELTTVEPTPAELPEADDGSRPPSPSAGLDEEVAPPQPAAKLNAIGLLLPPSRSTSPVGKTSTQPAMSDSGLDTDDELAGVSFSRSASGNVLAAGQDVQAALPDQQAEMDLGQRDEPSLVGDDDVIVCVQATPYENKENDQVLESEKGLSGDGILKPGTETSLSPRVALTQKDANAVRAVVDIVV